MSPAFSLGRLLFLINVAFSDLGTDRTGVPGQLSCGLTGSSQIGRWRGASKPLLKELGDFLEKITKLG